MKRRVGLILVASAWFVASCASLSPKPVEQWSVEQANDWYDEMPWLVGCNFTPSTAINQLEMWQLNTFDSATIDRELAWAKQLGFNSIRVYLHHLLWEQHARGLLHRMERFLDIAGTQLIAQDDFGKIWRCELQIDDEPHRVVEVVNATAEPDGSYRRFLLRVPPTTRTAREGVAWTFGFDNPADYLLAAES